MLKSSTVKIIPRWVRRIAETLLILGIILTAVGITIRFLDYPTSRFLKENAEVIAAEETFTATDETLIFYPTIQLAEGENLTDYECSVFAANLTGTVELEASATSEYLTGTGFRYSGMFTDYYYTCGSAPDSFWFYIVSETEYNQYLNYYQNLYQDFSILSILIGGGSLAISLVLYRLIRKSNQTLLASWKLHGIALSGTRVHQRRIRAMSVYRKTAFTVIMLAFGIVLTTPMIAMMINMIRDQQTTSNYIASTQTLADVEEMLQAAYDYNQELYENGASHYGEIEDPYSTTEDSDDSTEGESDEESSDTTTVDPDYERYTNLLNQSGGVMAVIEYPSLGINMSIYHGTDSGTLSLGAGHLYGSSLPVGGENTHSIITAHSGLGTHIMFDRLTLKQFNIGDIFYITVLGETLAYQVVYYNIIDPNGDDVADYLAIQEGKDLVTLFTCYPYQVNTQRMLVTAERIDLELAKQLEQSSAIGLEYWLALAAAIVWFGDIRSIVKTWKNE